MKIEGMFSQIKAAPPTPFGPPPKFMQESCGSGDRSIGMFNNRRGPSSRYLRLRSGRIDRVFAIDITGVESQAKVAVNPVPKVSPCSASRRYARSQELSWHPNSMRRRGRNSNKFGILLEKKPGMTG